MSTYLQICKDVCREVGIAQGEDAISTVASQSGDLARIVAWVRDEWTKIQRMNSGTWRWLRVTATLNTVNGTGAYAYTSFTDTLTSSAISRFNRWSVDDILDPPRLYLQSAGLGGEVRLTYIPWDLFKNHYKLGVLATTTGQPQHITVDPQDKIVYGFIPNAVYVGTVDYYRSPQVLTADGDIPECPTHFHDLLMYKAVARYGVYKNKREAVITGTTEGDKLMKQLLRNQRPQMRLAGPMVE
jgi:hypothetical protein